MKTKIILLDLGLTATSFLSIAQDRNAAAASVPAPSAMPVQAVDVKPGTDAYTTIPQTARRPDFDVRDFSYEQKQREIYELKKEKRDKQKEDENDKAQDVAMPDEQAKPDYDWNKYLSENVQYPKSALENNIQGRLIVKFIVEKDGSLSNAIVIRGADLGHGLPEECIRIVKAAAKWNPATLKGVPVRSYFMVPFSFRLPDPEPEQESK